MDVMERQTTERELKVKLEAYRPELEKSFIGEIRSGLFVLRDS